MTGMTRRGLVGTALGAGMIAPALGAEPASLRGSVQDGRVNLPPLHQASEQNGTVPNPMPPDRRLGVCVVGLGALALQNIMAATATRILISYLR